MKRAAIAILALSMLAACGVKASPQRPDPMWNREEAMQREREAIARGERPSNALPPQQTATDRGSANSLPGQD